MDRTEKLKGLRSSDTTAVALNNLERKFGEAIPDDLLDLLIDINSFSSVQPQQLLNWVFNVKRVAEAILSGQASSSDYSVFWIGVYGVMEEVEAHYRMFVTTLE